MLLFVGQVRSDSHICLPRSCGAPGHSEMRRNRSAAKWNSEAHWRHECALLLASPEANRATLNAADVGRPGPWLLTDVGCLLTGF